MYVCIQNWFLPILCVHVVLTLQIHINQSISMYVCMYSYQGKETITKHSLSTARRVEEMRNNDTITWHNGSVAVTDIQTKTVTLLHLCVFAEMLIRDRDVNQRQAQSIDLTFPNYQKKRKNPNIRTDHLDKKDHPDKWWKPTKRTTSELGIVSRRAIEG